MADTIHMIKTNISKDKIKFTNLHRSFFSDLNNTKIEITDNKVMIYESSNQNPDPACVELENLNNFYIVYFWDGYSLADRYKSDDYKSAILEFKKFAKKLAKNLRRF